MTDDCATAAPADLLVERVAWACDCPTRDDARVAILEVAAWLEAEGYFPAARALRLEQEAP